MTPLPQMLVEASYYWLLTLPSSSAKLKVTLSGEQGSAEVRDLIHRLLRPNPAERMTMQQLFDHPWFQQDLADGALQLNDTLLQAVGAEYADAGNLQVSPAPLPDHTHEFTHVFTRSLVHTRTSALTHIYTHTCTHTCGHTHLHTYGCTLPVKH